LLKATGEKMAIDIEILSLETSGDVPIADEAKVFVGGRFNDLNCLSELRKIVLTEEVNIVLACHDAAIQLLPEISDITFAPCCSAELISTYSQKRSTSKFLRASKIPVPLSPRSAPAIAKPNNGSASKGLCYLHTENEFQSFLLRSDVDEFDLQSLMTGPEFSVDVYVPRSGNYIPTSQRIRIEVSGGEVVKTKIVDEASITEIVAQITSIPGTYGPMTVQLIWDEPSERFYVMEVNPRFGGGMPASVLAGTPFLDIVVSDYLHREIPKSRSTVGVTVSRSFREHKSRDIDETHWRNGAK
jgi:carbamoyl-phosphate synthase large subunit